MNKLIMEKYKTIHENKNELEQFFSKKNLVEKIEMYNKLSKKELILMLIEANKYLDNRQPYITYPDQVPYNELCSCNPKNGGSGICGCTMGNKMVTTKPFKTEYITELTYNSAKINKKTEEKFLLNKP